MQETRVVEKSLLDVSRVAEGLWVIERRSLEADHWRRMSGRRGRPLDDAAATRLERGTVAAAGSARGPPQM